MADDDAVETVTPPPDLLGALRKWEFTGLLNLPRWNFCYWAEWELKRALKFNHRKGKLCCGHALADIGVHYTERQSPNYNYEMTFSGLGCILVVSFRELPAHWKGPLYLNYWVWIWSLHFKENLLFQRRLRMASPERSRDVGGDSADMQHSYAITTVA